MTRTTRTARSLFVLAAAVASPAVVHAHGTVLGSRMMQVRQAGPAGGTPAAWNDSYYTWNQNSRNLPAYGQFDFRYSNVVPDGTIASFGVNDGTNGSLNFSGLNTPSAGWKTSPATAGQTVPLTWIATASHDPSYFQIFLTKPGVDVTTQPLTWAGLQDLGRWSTSTTLAGNPVTVGTATNPLTNSATFAYNWSVPIPADRSGRVSMVVVWQRDDPAGEAFMSVSDFQVGVPEPTTATTTGVLATTLLRRRRKN